MSECQACSAKSTLFVCPRCVHELRAQLHSLAHGPEVNGRPTTGLLDALSDVALKRTCMGGGSGHRKRGDEIIAPFEGDTDKGRQTAQGRAAMLLDSARNTLTTIVRDVCESRGVDELAAFRAVLIGFVGPLLPGWQRVALGWRPETSEVATWLARNVHALACDESAGQWRAEVDVLVRGIGHLIDRPMPVRLLGFCATDIDGEACGTALRARDDEVEVRCRKCRTVRRCDRVRMMAQSDARKTLITWEQVLDANKRQPDGWRVNDRTLRHWRSTGGLTPRRFLRPDESIVICRLSDDDVPLYKWEDVEKMRADGDVRRRKRTRVGI